MHTDWYVSPPAHNRQGSLTYMFEMVVLLCSPLPWQNGSVKVLLKNISHGQDMGVSYSRNV